MNKKILYGLVASLSMVSAGAYATDASENAVTTKGYVDAGLKYVYKVANGTENGAVKNINEALSDGNGGLINVGDLKEKIGAKGTGDAAGSGLAGDVQSLEKTIGDENSGLVKKVNTLAASSKTYDAGDGIKVTAGANEGDPATIGLKLPDNPAAGTYVYQIDANGNGTWQALEVEDDWDEAFLNQ
ncbi:MAG: hypothetical protein J6T57_02530 [Alphaproteobacteria bacterium]|nr:hypothetical protein [Alphaproteobacteria bacterium]